jgi:hypothetical protein
MRAGLSWAAVLCSAITYMWGAEMLKSCSSTCRRSQTEISRHLLHNALP